MIPVRPFGSSLGPIWTIIVKALDTFVTLDYVAHKPKGSGKRGRMADVGYAMGDRNA